MIESVFRSPALARSLRRGLIGPTFDDFVDYLIARGHSTVTVRNYVQAAAHFDNWLRRTHRTVAEVDETVLQAFFRHLSRCRCAPPRLTTIRKVRPSIQHMLTVLRQTQRAPPRAAPKMSPRAKVVNAFVAHLREHGAAAETCYRWGRYVAQFLGDRFRHGAIDFSHVTVRHVTAFFIARSGRWAPRSMNHAASALRRFFRYLQGDGKIDGRLALAVPKFPAWRLASVPRVLRTDQVAAVLGSFDRTTSIGLRGYAITMCLVDLGLRGCEVAGLTLDDLDWRAATITVRASKTYRSDVLPLPPAVGRAILAYLRRGRPKTTSRQIFVRHRAPLAPPSTPGLARYTLRRACARAGLPLRSISSHMFRHTVATQLLAAGVNLKGVADVLRHRRINSSAIYAKVDLKVLREVAGAWPRPGRP